MSACESELRDRRESPRSKQAVTLEVSYTTCAGEFEAEFLDNGVDGAATNEQSVEESCSRPLGKKGRSSSVPSAEVGGWDARPLVAFGQPNQTREPPLGRVHEVDLEDPELPECGSEEEDPLAPRGSTEDGLVGPPDMTLAAEPVVEQRGADQTQEDLVAAVTPAVINALSLAITGISNSVENAVLSGRFRKDTSAMSNEHVTDANRMKTEYGLGVSTEVRSSCVRVIKTVMNYDFETHLPTSYSNISNEVSPREPVEARAPSAVARGLRRECVEVPGAERCGGRNRRVVPACRQAERRTLEWRALLPARRQRDAAGRRVGHPRAPKQLGRRRIEGVF